MIDKNRGIPHREIVALASLRSFLLVLLLSAGAWAQTPAPGPDTQFRYRAQSIDNLLTRARTAWEAKKMPLATYRHLLELLRAEEAQIATDVRAHKFQDISESNYWHRGRLKFPSELQQEWERHKAAGTH